MLVSEILGYSALVRSGHLGKHPEVLKDTVVRLLAIKEGGEAIDIMRTTLVMDILERVSCYIFRSFCCVDFEDIE